MLSDPLPFDRFHITRRHIDRLTFHLGRIIAYLFRLRRLSLTLNDLSQDLLPKILLQILDQVCLASILLVCSPID